MRVWWLVWLWYLGSQGWFSWSVSSCRRVHWGWRYSAAFPGTAHCFPESVGGVTWCPLVTSLLLAPNVTVTNHAAQQWFISDETAAESTSRFQTAGGHSYNNLGIHSKNHGKFLENISD